jgi:hypothetical protein
MWEDKQRDRERLQALTTACPEGAPPEHVCYFLQVDVREAVLLIEEFKGGALVSKSAAKFARPQERRLRAE